MAYVAAAMAVANVVMGAMASSAAHDKQRRINKITSEMNEKESEMKVFARRESVRRQTLAHDNAMTQANQDIGAGGFSTKSKSHNDHLSAVETEFQKALTYNKDIASFEDELSQINQRLLNEGASGNGQGIALAANVVSGIASVYGASQK